ncbi:MAG: IS30 family transposase, partial [Leptolyngbya sp. RL_3_1]|nr:IS30 family transposase [Leptolyngbya sp. RL_3_1]
MFTTTKGHPMSYTQLSCSERFTLYHLRIEEKLSMSEIAKQMKRSESTISRELKRNRINTRLYLPDTAQQMMQARRAQSKQPFMSVSAVVIEKIKQHLQQYHSPEQLCGRLKRDGFESPSHETLYQMLYANHQGLGTYQ